MIGIPQLDRLPSGDMLSIINGEIRIAVQDPRKIQTTISEISEPRLTDQLFMDDERVKTLLKMELESRAGWEYLRQKILEGKK